LLGQKRTGLLQHLGDRLQRDLLVLLVDP
jgi:hypothetical protein